jgi:cytoskeletal protein CcmA (bactofilin family)
MAFWNKSNSDNVGGSIIVNGKNYGSGTNVRVANGKVYIDDKIQESSDDKNINIQINGDIESLNVDICDKIIVQGNVDNVETTNGNVQVDGIVLGNVKTTNGSVKIGGSVQGEVSTVNGSIKGM